MRRALALAVVVLLSAAPRVAEACSVCTSGRDDETRLAYLLTTLFLSVLPLGLIAGLAWWFVRRSREADRAELTAPEGVSRAPSSP